MARKRVLIVEDKAKSRGLTRQIVEWCGYAVAEAVDGTDGLAQAERMHPDVILLDVLMPGLDGYEVCRGLKDNPETQHIPVIFLMAVEDVALNPLAFQVGAVACITKPFRREALVAVIEAALGSAGRQAEPKPKDGANGL